MISINASAIAPRDVEAEAWDRAMRAFGDDKHAVTFLEQKSGQQWREIDIEDLGTGGLTRAGVTIGAESALQIGAVFGCRRVIAEDVAKMPRLLKQTLVERDGSTKTLVVHPSMKPNGRDEQRLVSIARALSVDPCEWLTAMQFFEWFVGTAVTQRAAYAVPTVNGKGEIEELLPLLPGSVSVVQTSDWSVEYHVSGYGNTWVLRPGQILQLTGPLNTTLLEGYAVSSLAREAIGLAAAIEQSQSRFHANDLRPAAMITAKGPVTKEQREAIKIAWEQNYGPGGKGGIAVMDGDFDYKAFTATAADSQTLENRDHQVSEICRFFRVFPQLIGHSGGINGYGTFEQAMENHAKLTLMPWVERVEQALMKGLLTPQDRAAGYHIHIDVDAIARGTFTDRVSSYEKAAKVFLTPNEIRMREGLDPIADPAMDRVQLQANNTGLVPGATPAKPAAPAEPARKPQQQEPAP